MSKNSSRENTWAISKASVQIKSAEINSFRSWEISFIRLWHVQAADSVDTEGKMDLGKDLLSVWQIWPLADWVNTWVGGWRKEKLNDKKVVCRLLTHLEQPQVHFQFGSFSGHRHKYETIVGTNKK